MSSVKKPALKELDLVGQIKRVFGEEAHIALSIAKAESGLNCKVISKPNKNGTKDSGLFQLNSAFHPYIPDCLENMLRAKKIRDQWGNYNAWSVCKNGKVNCKLYENL